MVCQPRLPISSQSAREIFALENARRIAAEGAGNLMTLVRCVRMTFESCFRRNNFTMKVLKITWWLFFFVFLLNYVNRRNGNVDY